MVRDGAAEQGSADRLGGLLTNGQIPHWSDLTPLLRRGVTEQRRGDRRLSRAISIPDLAVLARRRAPRAVFEYVHGAADDETALARSRHAFLRAEIMPAVLRDVSRIDITTSILGQPSALPLILAPTGFTRMMHVEGEAAVARVASRAGIVYTLATMGTISLEDLAREVPHGRRWFQLYLLRDRELSADLVLRAARSGYEALVLTVDTPVTGARLRDLRNGLTIPPALTRSALFDAALHPAWWFDFLGSLPLEFASLHGYAGSPQELADLAFDPSLSLTDLAWLRGIWPGRLVVKGILTVTDARAVVDHGADAIVVSDHGGRQLSRGPTPLAVLPRIVAAVGDRTEVYVDGGVLYGSDVVAAVGLGARAVLVGRAYLYGLMAAGEPGVARAVDLLTSEIVRTMRLAGVTTLSELVTEGRVHLPRET